jgi:hypothetical protein
MRWLATLALLAIAGTLAGIVISDQTSSNPKLVPQFSQDAKQAIDEVKQLIDDNVK